MNAFIAAQIDEYIQTHHYRQINSVLLYQKGQILANRLYNGFQETSGNPICSVAKSIMSIGTGIARDQGLISSLDEPIARYLPEFNEGRDFLHRRITIRHLLTMSSGIFWNGGVHYHCPMMKQLRASDDWISHIADCAVTDIPGRRYNYKEWDVILLAKILDCACGDLFDFLNENLFEPLSIHNERWYQSPCGVYYSVGDDKEEDNDTKLKMNSLQLLKIGQLFLYGGIYQDKQILSREYIKEATSPSACNPGYGYLWWVFGQNYACRGYGGQRIMVFPNEEAIVVTLATPTDRGMAYEDVIEYCMSTLKA